MKNTKIMNNVMKGINKVGLKLKKQSPTICMVGGIVGMGVCTILACKQTTKLSEILEESQENIDKIHKCSEDEKLADQYSKEDAKKDTAIVYMQTGVKIAKLYAAPAVIGVVSVVSIVASHNIMTKRNVALAAAYATVDKTFKEYRSRVVDRFGEQVDHELRYDIKAKKFEKTETDPETGKEKKVKSTVDVSGLNNSPYTTFFDETTSKAYENNDDYNRMFLRSVQQWANDKLKVQGYLFLNDVYDALGMARTKAGQIVGWVYRPNDKGRDAYVDFRVFETNREDCENDYKKSWLLDFNVDGNILDLI